MLSSNSQNTLHKLLNKESYVPPAQGGPPGGAPPMPPPGPAAGGGGAPMPMPPPDPAAGGGAPMPMPPPGGAPPMDPAMMGMDPNMMPADPTMGGPEGGEGVPVVLDINDLKAILEEASQGNDKIDRLEKIVESMAKRMGIEVEQDPEKEQTESEELPAYLQVPGMEQAPEQGPEQSAVTPEAQQAVSQQQAQGQGSSEDLEGLVNMMQGA